MALPRALLQALEQAMDVHEEPGGKAAGHLAASTPQCKDPTLRQPHTGMSQALLSFNPQPIPTSRVVGGLHLVKKGIFQRQLYSLRKCFSHHL